MSQPRWVEIDLSTVMSDGGWHYDDDATMHKLVNSLQRHGQLQPLVVRGIVEDESMCTLVHGHKLLAAMLALGWKKGMAVHVGALDPVAAARVRLAMEIDFETDYANMVQVVAGLLNEHGLSVAEVAAGSPFDEERIKHFGTLATLDWSVFNVDDGQAKLDWDALAAEEPVPLSPVVERMVDAAAEVLDRTRPDTTVEQLAEAMGAALEDVTAPEPQPAAAAPVVPALPAEPAAPAGEAAAQPEKAAKPKRAKAEKPAKVPDAQMGLF